MTNDTRFKVDEALYFLSTMKQTYNNHSDDFYFNLHAFFASFRSITYYMQKQYKKCNWFPEWYCKKQIEMSNDSDLHFLLKIRNEIIHRNPANTYTEYECFSPGVILNGNETEEEIEKKIDALDELDYEINIGQRFFEKNEYEIIEFCETQLKKITALVDECELKNTSSPHDI